MRTATYLTDEHASRLQERGLTLTAPLGGVEVRPTRLFVWAGHRGHGREWLYSLGQEPRLLRFPRRRRHVQVAWLNLSYLGNPVVTLSLFLGRFLRRSRRRTGLQSG